MYAMSFLTLGIFWIGQQTQLNHLARADRDLAWIHIGFLALVAIMPFSTILLAEFIEFRTALLVYWGNVALLATALYFAWRYLKASHLLKVGTIAEAVVAIDRRIVSAQFLYALGAPLAACRPRLRRERASGITLSSAALTRLWAIPVLRESS
jgi:uncharacterized membrane protein